MLRAAAAVLVHLMGMAEQVALAQQVFLLVVAAALEVMVVPGLLVAAARVVAVAFLLVEMALVPVMEPLGAVVAALRLEVMELLALLAVMAALGFLMVFLFVLVEAQETLQELLALRGRAVLIQRLLTLCLLEMGVVQQI